MRSSVTICEKSILLVRIRGSSYSKLEVGSKLTVVIVHVNAVVAFESVVAEGQSVDGVGVTVVVVGVDV